jgi:hypothetical protein
MVLQGTLEVWGRGFALVLTLSGEGADLLPVVGAAADGQYGDGN